MTMTNINVLGSGIHMQNAKVELFDVALKGSQHAGLYVHTSTSATTLVATRCEFTDNKHGARVFGILTSAIFNNCIFNENEYEGIEGNSSSTIHLHGEATAIHSNGRDGILAYGCGIGASNFAKVIIHLPSYHNTSYNNGDEDRETIGGGTITNVD